MIYIIFILFVIAANSEAILVNTTTNSDYVLVIANNTNPDTIPVSEFEKRDNSLQPENDKTDAFVNKFFVPEPSAEDEDTNEDRKVFPLPELKFSKLPKLPKFPSIFPPRKIIVYLTTTEVQHKTVYNTIYPSCLKLSPNVQSICDGTLVTVTPSRPPLPGGNIWRTELNELPRPANTENATKEDVINEGRSGRNLIQPSSTQSIQTTRLASLADEESRKNVLAASELDNEFDLSEESSTIEHTTSLPFLNVDNDADSAKIAFFPQQSVEHEIKYITKYLQVTKTQQLHDNAHTATVIAENCFPSNLNLPFCETNPLVFIRTFLISKHPDTKPSDGGSAEKLKQPPSEVLYSHGQINPHVLIKPEQPQQPEQPQILQLPQQQEKFTIPIFDLVIQTAVQNLRNQIRGIATQDIQRIASSANSEIKVYGPLKENSVLLPQYLHNVAVSYPLQEVHEPILIQDSDFILNSVFPSGRALKSNFKDMHYFRSNNKIMESESKSP